MPSTFNYKRYCIEHIAYITNPVQDKTIKTCMKWSEMGKDGGSGGQHKNLCFVLKQKCARIRGCHPLKSLTVTTINIGLKYSCIKEASYSKVPEVISLQFNGFPILAFIRIPFINFRGGLTSMVSERRFCNFPYLALWQVKPRKLSSWDQFPPIWDRLRSGMLRSHKIYCTLSP